ncbi:MAG: ArsR/SmtB family transcription factor [Planctomycetota bacterium]|jgi:ArsR family transcriptional regulator
MERIADILKALGENTRLRLLRLLASHELAVNELVEVLAMPQPRVSRHLGVLRRAALVQDRREGNWIYYHMAPEELSSTAKSIWEALPLATDGADYFPQDLSRVQEVLRRRDDRTKVYFDGVEKEWDRIRRNYIDDPFSAQVVAGLVGPQAVAADIGVGTGELLAPLARNAARVIGVDNSEKMLDACRRRIAEDGLTNVELRPGEAEALPLADGECDVAFSSMVLHHLSDPARGAKELGRVVKPGGKVIVCDLVKHDADWVRQVMADTWLGFTEQQMCQWLMAAGLTDIVWSSTAVPEQLKNGSSVKLGGLLAEARRLVTSRPPGASEKLRAFIASGTKPQS